MQNPRFIPALRAASEMYINTGQCILVLLLEFGTEYMPSTYFWLTVWTSNVAIFQSALPPLSHLGVISVWKLDLWAGARNSLLQGHVTSELCTKGHSKAGEARGGECGQDTFWGRHLSSPWLYTGFRIFDASALGELGGALMIHLLVYVSLPRFPGFPIF